jgi:hypothetical protein
VYGPQEDADKILFLQELEDIRDACPRPWALTGDFNLILTRPIRATIGWIELTFVDSNERWPRWNYKTFISMGGALHGATKGRTLLSCVWTESSYPLIRRACSRMRTYAV